MLTPAEIESASMLFDGMMKRLEESVMQDIVRRIRINGEITRSADWQMHRLYELGESKRALKKIIKDTLDLDSKEIAHLYKDILRKGYERDRGLYKAKGQHQIPFAKNEGLQQYISAVAQQTGSTMKNLSQSMGFSVNVGGKVQFQPIAAYYQDTLDNAVNGIATGAFDYNTVLKRTVKEMTDSGLRTVDYASGHVDRVDVAARRAVMTGLTQITAKVNDDNAKALETDTFEISWHSGARPSHQVWQGRWYTEKELTTVCGLGSVTGLCGANCYHSYYPVIPGVSVPNYTEEELDEMNRRENEPVEYNGREYTKYEATQRQRYLERKMRAERQEIKLLQDGGSDENDLIAARCRYRQTSQTYRDFSKAMELPEQRQRVTIDGLGNIGQGKWKNPSKPVANSGGSGEPSPVRVPGSGVHVTGKVPDTERRELLQHPRKASKSGTTPPPYMDVLDEYIKSATPGVGTITRDSDYIEETHREEIEFADMLHKKFGGDIHIQQEHHDKPYPDYIWRGKLWELKSPESQNGTNSALRKGYNQISENPGGVILDYGDHEIDMNFVLNAIIKRMRWYSGDTMDIMIAHRGEIKKILRYKKR